MIMAEVLDIAKAARYTCVSLVHEGTIMFDRIEIDPRRCGGSPVIRGTRIPVAVLLDELATGESWDSVLAGYPELAREDIQAALRFAKASVEHTEIFAVEAR